MASVMVERPPSAHTHTKLHKRAPSDTARLPRKTSTMPSPVTSVDFKRKSVDFKRNVTYDEPQSPSTSSLKLKSYGRKSSVKDGSHVDLSRSMAENESLTGLGLGGVGDPTYENTYTFGPRSASDVSFTPVRNHRHRRSTSGNSHLSSTSNGLRQQPSTYVNPLLQTPRPYTPPSRSYQSTAGSISGTGQEDTIAEIPRPADEAEALRRLMSNSSSEQFGRRSESLSNFPNLDTRPSLQMRTSDSSEHFASPSQISLSGRRSRGATIQSIDTASPSSRPSLDKAFNFIRGQRSNDTESETIMHDASRAAGIRAARQAYQEREEAKDRKAEKEDIKRAEQEQKKQHKREERKRRRSEALDRPSHSNEKVANEKGNRIGGAEYAALQANSRAQPKHVESVGPAPPIRQDTNRSMTKKRGPKSTWAIFLAWFRTRLLRMGA